MRQDSARSSPWNSRFGRLTIRLLAGLMRMARVLAVDSYLSVMRPEDRVVFVKNAFYRPALLASNWALWGLQYISLPANARKESADIVLNNRLMTGSNVLPLGFLLARAMPESVFSVVRDSGAILGSGNGKWVVIGDPAKDLVLVRLRTRSYFHFLLEIIPVLLQHLDSKSLLLLTEYSWQRELLSHFGISFWQIGDSQLTYDFVIEKSRWGLYPREDHLLALRQFFIENQPTIRQEQSERILVNRTPKTTQTGRVPSSALVRSLSARFGLGILDPGSIPLSTQFESFSAAKLIIGPHGSALASIVAALSLKALVELHATERVSFHVEHLSRVFAVPYRAVLVEEKSKGVFSALPTGANRAISEFLLETNV